MTSDYARFYSKGYNAGRRRALRFMDTILAEAKRLRERAQRAEAAQGLGSCQNCAHWARNEGCYWGHCLQPRSRTVETPWFREDRASSIVTQENFGCVLFVDRSGNREGGQ